MLDQTEKDQLIADFKSKMIDIASKYELTLDKNQASALYDAYLFGNETMLKTALVTPPEQGESK